MNQALQTSNNHKRGVSLIEVVVGSSIILLVTLAITTLYSGYIRAASESTDRIKATLYAREGIEVMRFLRDTDWDTTLGSYSLNTDYYIVASSTTFIATTSPQSFIDNIFDRRVVIEEVYRDGNQNIAPSGTLDGNIKKITATVAWLDRGATTTKSFSAYLTHLNQ